MNGFYIAAKCLEATARLTALTVVEEVSGVVVFKYAY